MRRLVSLWLTLLAAFWLTLQAAKALRRHDRAAALACDWALALLLTAAALAALGFARQPAAAAAPWNRAAAALASLSVTALLVGAALAALSRPPAAARLEVDEAWPAGRQGDDREAGGLGETGVAAGEAS